MFLWVLARYVGKREDIDLQRASEPGGIVERNAALEGLTFDNEDLPNAVVCITFGCNSLTFLASNLKKSELVLSPRPADILNDS